MNRVIFRCLVIVCLCIVFLFLANQVLQVKAVAVDVHEYLDKKDVITLDELIEGSKKEGQLLCYTSKPEWINAELLKEFRKTYPWVKTDFVRGGGPQIGQRVYADKAAGVEKFDYVHSGASELYPDWKRKGFLARVDNLPNWNAVIELARGKGGRYVNFDFETHVMAWDRNVYKDEEVPSDLREFTKPKWKNKTVSGDPATAGFATMWYSFVSDSRPKDSRSTAAPSGLGFEWMKAMAKNGILLAGQIGNTMDAIVSGRRPILIQHWDQEVWMANKQGANLGWRYPDQGTLAQQSLAAVNSKAPHPYTARLYLNWLISKEGQTSIAQMGFNIVRKDMKMSDFIQGRMDPLTKGWILDIELITGEETREFNRKVNDVMRGQK